MCVSYECAAVVTFFAALSVFASCIIIFRIEHNDFQDFIFQSNSSRNLAIGNKKSGTSECREISPIMNLEN